MACFTTPGTDSSVAQIGHRLSNTVSYTHLPWCLLHYNRGISSGLPFLSFFTHRLKRFIYFNRRKYESQGLCSFFITVWTKSPLRFIMNPDKSKKITGKVLFIMKNVIIKQTVLGQGMPKICAPLVEKDYESLIHQAESFTEQPVDVAEWRADWFDSILEPDILDQVLPGLESALKDIPLLFTFRTQREGGHVPAPLPAYRSLAVSYTHLDVYKRQGYTTRCTGRASGRIPHTGTAPRESSRPPALGPRLLSLEPHP